MTDIIGAMNPTAPLTTEEAALGAAKVSAIGMVIGAISQAVGGWYASTPAASEAAALSAANEATPQVSPTRRDFSITSSDVPANSRSTVRC